MNADQIIANLEMSNGDGCEYIFHIKNLNSGDIIFEGDYNDVTFEDDELEEALSAEDARNASEAAEKAKEYFDKASKACDAILREETNIDIDDETIIIFDRVDNNKEEKSFECEVDFHDMDILLLDIENHEKIGELNIKEFYDEIINICSDGLNIVKFMMSIEALSKYIENKNAQL